MRITFHLPAALQPFADGQNSVEIDVRGATLADALSALWKHYPGIRDRTATEQGQVREHINVFVADENVRFTGGLMTPLSDGAEITILPAVSGGSEEGGHAVSDLVESRTW